MPDYSIHRASDLVLLIDETIGINPYRPHSAPDSAERQGLRRDIVAQARETGARAEHLTDRELDDLLDSPLILEEVLLYP